jgi:hypothetical protein
MPYIAFRRLLKGPPATPPAAASRGNKRTKAMTLEILHLTTQIQRWLNQRIAQHLAEQAERLAR